MSGTTSEVLEALSDHSLGLVVSSTIEVDLEGLSQANLSLRDLSAVKVLTNVWLNIALRIYEVVRQRYGLPSLSRCVVAQDQSLGSHN